MRKVAAIDRSRSRGDGRRSGGSEGPRPLSGSLDLQGALRAWSSDPCPVSRRRARRTRTSAGHAPATGSSGGSGHVTETYTWPSWASGRRRVPRTSPSRSQPPVGSSFQGRERSPSRSPRDDGLRTETSWNPCRTSRRSSRSPAAPARSPRRRGEGQLEALARWRRWNRDLDGHARGAGSRVRPDAAEAERSDREDGSRAEEGGEERPRDLQGDGDRRRGRRSAGLRASRGRAAASRSARTTVRCSATDSSGNTAQASFVVTVKPRR